LTSKKKPSGELTFELRNTYTRVKQTPAPKSLPIDPKRPVELKLLDKFLGVWRNELVVKTPQDGQSRPLRAEYRSRWILGGQFLEAHETNLQTGVADYWLFGLAPAQRDGRPERSYRFWHFASDGGYVMDGTWDAGKQTLSWKGKDGTVAGRETFLPDGSRDMSFKFYDPQGNLVLETEGKALKVSETSEKEKLRGVWKAVKIAGKGDQKLDDIPKAIHWTFTIEETKATFHFRATDPFVPGRVIDEKKYEGVFTPDTSTDPKRLTLYTPGVSKTSFLGIYRWDGERLQMSCYFDPKEKQGYPRSLTPGEDRDAVLFVLERQPGAPK
jgi:uncharacterized protein (TIGR03067 family)